METTILNLDYTNITFGESESITINKSVQAVFYKKQLIGWLYSSYKNFFVPVDEIFWSINLTKEQAIQVSSNIYESEDAGFYQISIQLSDFQKYEDLYEIVKKIYEKYVEELINKSFENKIEFAQRWIPNNQNNKKIKDIEKIKEELQDFGKKHRACERGLESIKGTTLIELFNSIYKYIYWCKENKEKTIEFNNIFNNELVIENGVLLCDCTNLESIIIPNSVTSIGNYAFIRCTELTSIEIPNSVTSIGNYAFSECRGLTSIEIPNSVTSIGNYAFSECRGLTSIVIPDSVTPIGNYAFSCCDNLSSIIISNSVTSIGKSSFSNCKKLTSVIIGNSVTTIGNHAFAYCSELTSVIIGNSVTTIGKCAFENCSKLTSVTIPNSVTSIGDFAFDCCRELTSVIIGNSVTTIGKYAFYGCNPNLKIIKEDLYAFEKKI